MMDAVTLWEMLRDRRLSAVEVLDECIKNIEKKDSELNAVLVNREIEAGKAAKKVQYKIDSGESLSFPAGIPCAIKNNICIRDERTTCASLMLESYRPPYDATVIERLTKNGAIINALTNMDEFAMGSTGESSYFGATRNPIDINYCPGGSSSGSAAAVAAGESWCALGSDTGGSVRLPAAYCGIVGLLPTYGLVSRYGLIAHVSSMDQIGSITRSVRDAAAVLNCISGIDKRDATSLPGVKIDLSGLDEGVGGRKIAMPLNICSGISGNVMKNLLDAAQRFIELGVMVDDVKLKEVIGAEKVYTVISCAEASSNLARYDGIKYGGFKNISGEFEQVYGENRRRGFGKEVRKRILFGSYVLGEEGYESIYVSACEKRRKITKEVLSLLENYDAILIPVTGNTVPGLGMNKGVLLGQDDTDRFTVIANLCGTCAVTVPFGRDENGMPIGIQLIGKRLGEQGLLTLARQFEKMVG